MAQASAYQTGRHLAVAEIVSATSKCPACGSKTERESVLTIQDNPAIQMLECKRCAMVSASHMPTDEVLQNYYARYYKFNTRGITFPDEAKLANRIWRHAKSIRPKNTIRVLDLGGGSGGHSVELARLAVEAHSGRSVEIVVVEYSNSVDWNEPGVSVSFVRDLDAAEGKFDIIIASAVLEHIPQIGACLRALFARASPGAVFYARAPYAVPIARIFRSFDLTYPGHVHDISPDFWQHVNSVYEIDAEVLVSRPSPVETTFRQAFFRTLVAYLLKAPCQVELRFHSQPWWRLVGGWEVILRFAYGEPSSGAKEVKKC